MRLNREGTQHVAERLISAGELYGDDVTDLLDGASPAQARDRRDATRRRGPRSDPAALARPGARRPTPSSRRAVAPREPEAPRRAEPAGRPARRRSAARFGFVTGRAGRLRASPPRCCSVVLLATATSRRRGASDEGLAANWSPWHPAHDRARSRARRRSPSKIEGNYKDAKAKKLAVGQGRADRAQRRCRSSVAIPAARRPLQIVDGVGHPVHARAASARTGGCSDAQAQQGSAGGCCGARRSSSSLYSFRYLPDVTMVVTLLPPAPKAEQVHPKPKAGAKAAKAQAEATSGRRSSTGPATCASSSSAPLDGHDGDQAAEDRRARRRRRRKRIDELTLSNLFTLRRTSSSRTAASTWCSTGPRSPGRRATGTRGYLS